MQIQVVPLIIICAYLIILILMGFLTNKFFIKTSTDYMLAGRSLGLVVVAASLSANNIGGGSTMGVATRAFGTWGLSAAWYVLAASIAMIPISYFAPKIRKVMAFTIPEVIDRRFGRISSSFTAVLNISSLFCLTASQILASGSVISSVTGLNIKFCILIAGVVALIYTVLGGLMADAIIDLLQWIVIFLGLLIAVPFIINGVGGIDAIVSKLPPIQLSFTKIGWFTIISLILNYFCTFMSGPEIISRFSAAENEKTAQKSAVLASIFMALMAFLPTIIGLAALSVNPELDGGKGTTALMWAATTHAPSWIAGLIGSAIIAATMSSADSNLLCASTIFVKDIYQKYINPHISDGQIMKMTRVSNVIIGIGAMIIALFNIDIVTLNLFAFALRSAGPFAAYTLGLAWEKATPHSGLFAIIVGSVAAVIWQVSNSPLGIMPIVFGSACSAATLVITSIIEGKIGIKPAPSLYTDKNNTN